MPQKGHNVIQKDILGRLGRLFLTYARIEREPYDKERDKKADIYKDSENAVPSVPTPSGMEVYRELKTPVPSVPTPTEVSNPNHRPYWRHPDASCYACHSTESWLSDYGVLICNRCHPPANDSLVSRWIGRA